MLGCLRKGQDRRHAGRGAVEVRDPLITGLRFEQSGEVRPHERPVRAVAGISDIPERQPEAVEQCSKEVRLECPHRKIATVSADIGVVKRSAAVENVVSAVSGEGVVEAITRAIDIGGSCECEVF
jgi:hypothetical protein